MSKLAFAIALRIRWLRQRVAESLCKDITPKYILFFFFQAEDGIRDHCVTGVQTCALPISCPGRWRAQSVPTRLVRQKTPDTGWPRYVRFGVGADKAGDRPHGGVQVLVPFMRVGGIIGASSGPCKRSEERRVGKEWRYRWLM